jgi:hypothetical protein
MAENKCKHCGADLVIDDGPFKIYECGGGGGPLMNERGRTAECYERELEQVKADRDRLQEKWEALLVGLEDVDSGGFGIIDYVDVKAVVLGIDESDPPLVRNVTLNEPENNE